MFYKSQHNYQSYIFYNFNPVLHLSWGTQLASSTSHMGTADHQQATGGFYYEWSPCMLLNENLV